MYKKSMQRVGSKRINIKNYRKVRNIHLGEHKSYMIGHGIDFEEHKEYVTGEPAKYIDWRVFARTDKLLTKLYQEDKNLDLIILADMTPSMEFGTKLYCKNEILMDIVTISALSTIENGDRFGFSDFRRYFYPRRERKHFNNIMHYITDIKPVNYDLKIKDAEYNLRRKVKKNSIVVMVSDFLITFDRPVLDFMENMNINYDFITIILRDERERFLPKEDVIISLMDKETGEIKTVQTKDFARLLKKKEQDIRDKLNSLNVKYFELTNDGNHLKKMMEFFNYR